MAEQLAESSPTCSVRWLDPLVRTLRRLDVDAEAVLAAEGLGPDALEDPDLRVPVETAAGVWRAGYDRAGDPALGIQVVEDQEVEPFSLGIYLAATSETARQAYARGIRYARIAHAGLDFQLRVEGGRCICPIRFGGDQHTRSEREYALGMAIGLVPLVTGGRTSEREVWFRDDAPPYAKRAEEVFGCSVRFGAPYDALVGKAELLDRPLPRSDSALCGILEEHAASLLARVPRPASFADQVRECLARELPRGDASAESVASALHVSPRTLRRRLQQAGSSYQRLLDEVRLGLARQALGHDGLSVNEIAFLLGFSDASAFHKAFLRWTGSRPGEYALRVRSGKKPKREPRRSPD